MNEERKNMRETRRELVIPGDEIELRGLKPGSGTYCEGGRAYSALLGIKSERSGFVNVIPLRGKYIPVPDDGVIGKIIDVGPSFWLVDINAPYPATLHVNEAPWKVEFGETARFMNVEDVVLAQVLTVDEVKRVQVTMRDRTLRKLAGGQLIEISPSKVPRVIGKKGSMITMIKNYTGCKLFVGQNGRIWIDGELQGIICAVQAIKMIESGAQAIGLTDAVESYLKSTCDKKM